MARTNDNIPRQKEVEQAEQKHGTRQYWKNIVGYQNRVREFETALDADPEYVITVARQMMGVGEEECWTAQEISDWGVRRIEFGEQ